MVNWKIIILLQTSLSDFEACSDWVRYGRRYILMTSIWDDIVVRFPMTMGRSVENRGGVAKLNLSNRSCLQLSSFHQSSKKTLRPGGYILRSCEPCASGRAADGGYEEERRVYLGKRQGKDGLDYDFV
jgi:hypothetical protein